MSFSHRICFGQQITFSLYMMINMSHIFTDRCEVSLFVCLLHRNVSSTELQPLTLTLKMSQMQYPCVMKRWPNQANFLYLRAGNVTLRLLQTQTAAPLVSADHHAGLHKRPLSKNSTRRCDAKRDFPRVSGLPNRTCIYKQS